VLDDLFVIPQWHRDALCSEPAYTGLPWFPEDGGKSHGDRGMPGGPWHWDDPLAAMGPIGLLGTIAAGLILIVGTILQGDS